MEIPGAVLEAVLYAAGADGIAESAHTLGDQAEDCDAGHEADEVVELGSSALEDQSLELSHDSQRFWSRRSLQLLCGLRRIGA